MDIFETYTSQLEEIIETRLAAEVIEGGGVRGRGGGHAWRCSAHHPGGQSPTLPPPFPRLLLLQVEGFSMSEFLTLLTSQPEELDGEVFDLLLTLSDFGAFKVGG